MNTIKIVLWLMSAAVTFLGSLFLMFVMNDVHAQPMPILSATSVMLMGVLGMAGITWSK